MNPWDYRLNSLSSFDSFYLRVLARLDCADRLISHVAARLLPRFTPSLVGEGVEGVNNLFTACTAKREWTTLPNGVRP